MKIKRCPDCSTGWCYAEDLPSKHQHPPHHHGLVPCPTCHGQGRVIVADDAPVQFAHEAEKRRAIAAARVDVRRPQHGADHEITLAYA